jgi:hypothetical protein
MTKMTFPCLTLAAVLACSVSPVFAQSSGVAEDHTGVFVNGTLSVPGAPTDVDSAPAKFSARNAADDKLSIAEYRLKGLSADQRSAIYDQLGKQSAAPASGDTGLSAVVGAQVPYNVVLGRGLKPLPAAVEEKVPELKGMVYTTSAGKVVLIDATTRTVVGVVTQ